MPAPAARTDLPYISNGIMDAIVRRVSDKVRGPRSPLSEVDIMDLAQVNARCLFADRVTDAGGAPLTPARRSQELMSEVWNVQDTLPR